MKTTIKKLEKSEVEITGVIEASDFGGFEDKALEKIGDRLEITGFRKGKAPKNVVKEKVGEMELLEEMAEQSINSEYPKILKENKIDAIGRPQITITKIGKGADLEFKILTAVLPKIDLPDYKKIAKDENSKEENKKEIVVDDKEIEATIMNLRRMKAEQSRPKHEHKEGESKEEHAKAHEPIPESDYPAFDDEFVKSFGNFKTADEFKTKIKENLKLEKETAEKDKVRLKTVEEIIKNTKGDIPEILIESEIEKILYKLKADIANTGFKYEDYLKQLKKTEEDLKKEWRSDAEKRAKLQMIIQKISEVENLKPTKEEIEKDVANIMNMYKEAEPARARAYVEQMLTNEKVFKFLEDQK